MSVTFAPRARIAVNASWPGVSRNVSLPPVDLGLVRADVLGDPARLGLDHRRRPDRVEQRRLAVVDVTHDRDDRRPGARGRPRRPRRPRARRRRRGVLDRHLALDLRGDQLHLLVGERLRGGPHLAEAHEHLDDLRHRDAERRRKVLDRDARLDRDGAGRLGGRLRARRRLGGAVACGAGVAAAGRATLDHDTATPASRAAAARADRAIRSVGSVSHPTPQCRGGRARADGHACPQGARGTRARRARRSKHAASRHVYTPRPGTVRPGVSTPLDRGEALELGLRRTAAAADARPEWIAALTRRRAPPRRARRPRCRAATATSAVSATASSIATASSA